MNCIPFEDNAGSMFGSAYLRLLAGWNSLVRLEARTFSKAVNLQPRPGANILGAPQREQLRFDEIDDGRRIRHPNEEVGSDGRDKGGEIYELQRFGGESGVRFAGESKRE